jgi:hypothetical protein
LFIRKNSFYICVYKNTVKAMDKRREKKANYNDTIIKELMAKYGFKRNYILMSIRGERTGTIPIKIQEEYKTLDSASKIAIRNKINEI